MWMHFYLKVNSGKPFSCFPSKNECSYFPLSCKCLFPLTNECSYFLLRCKCCYFSLTFMQLVFPLRWEFLLKIWMQLFFFQIWMQLFFLDMWSNAAILFQDSNAAIFSWDVKQLSPSNSLQGNKWSPKHPPPSPHPSLQRLTDLDRPLWGRRCRSVWRIPDQTGATPSPLWEHTNARSKTWQPYALKRLLFSLFFSTLYYCCVVFVCLFVCFGEGFNSLNVMDHPLPSSPSTMKVRHPCW